MSLGLGQSASAGWLWPEASAPYYRAQYFSRLIHPSVVAQILYERYGMARVLYVRQGGDVYYADALDRNGYRLSFTVDGYNGRVLESFVSRPRTAPSEEWGRDAAPRPRRALASRGEDESEPKARLPQKRDRPSRDVASRQSPAEQVEKDSPAPIRKDKTGKAVAVPPVNSDRPRPESGPAGPALELAKPSQASPKQSPDSLEPPRQAGPVARISEPLIDPRTGKPNTTPGVSVPPAPLDDASSAKRAQPTAIVPPAPLE